MTSPNGYNNPAYSHQFDSSLYDYEYVPEIDPESPESSRRQTETKLANPNYGNWSGSSEEFENSDESNRSIIIEECNNRRITLICEKRNKGHDNNSNQISNNNQKNYFDSNNGTYYQDISLESEDGYPDNADRKSENQVRRTDSVVSERHKRRLDPPVECSPRYPNKDNQDIRNVQSTKTLNCQPIPQRRHRYEEIDYDERYQRNEPPSRPQRSFHRYAEISADENGYPSLEKETQNEFSLVYPISFSPNFSISQTYQRTVSPHPPDFEYRDCRIPYGSSPSTNAIEMSELSPPRAEFLSNPSFLIRSPKRKMADQRQPPIGASSPVEMKESCKKITAKAVQKTAGKLTAERMNSPKSKDHAQEINSTPTKTVYQIFGVKTKPKSAKTPKSSAKRDISSSFAEPPEFGRSPRRKNPYVTTTAELKQKTAIVTPILQRKSQKDNRFEKTSQMFQSTGNILQNPTDRSADCAGLTQTRIKRNQSVPNFAQTAENRITPKKNKESGITSATPKNSLRKLECQYSPASIDRFLAINRSRSDLMDESKTWSDSGGGFRAASSGCLSLAAVVQLLAGLASCGVGFYLFSKVGRRYYLDFGILAGFFSLILGALGFRSHCWRWLPNRNYVSGYIVLAAFSVLTCGGLVFLITAKPMAGDPMLDVMGGAICGVSVLTIVMAITGLTMSGCCKTPPPDNRVTNL